ncbi:hypothetical protein BMS3Abin07_00144 [bacterium BMS3Abin07]|nr:hypothetical protein BMS3Abin07_00144 [bacterium BMS3Abin07]HDH07630.1 hypothetical protein [Candidatus Moranbacteria bacterium]
MKELTSALNEIKNLVPTCEEIEEYGEKNEDYYGVVTITQNEEYFIRDDPHNTWGLKRGGRVHIDIGCCGYHLMLDKRSVWDFISFIKEKRKAPTLSNSG